MNSVRDFYPNVSSGAGSVEDVEKFTSVLQLIFGMLKYRGKEKRKGERK